MEKEFNLSEKRIYKPLEFAYPERDIKEFIRLLKDNNRFKQTGELLANELDLKKNHKNALLVARIQLMFTDILLEIDKLAGDELI